MLSDDGEGVRLGEPDPPEEPLTFQASVPPHQLRLDSLRPHSTYHIRLACASRQGPSLWTHWLPVETPEGGKELMRGDVACCPSGLCSHQYYLQHLLSPMWLPSPSRAVPTPQPSAGISPRPPRYASALGHLHEWPLRIPYAHCLHFLGTRVFRKR